LLEDQSWLSVVAFLIKTLVLLALVIAQSLDPRVWRGVRAGIGLTPAFIVRFYLCEPQTG
jgi:hypothetical protein